MSKVDYTIAVLPGDGIGQEVTDAVLPIFKALDLPMNLILGDIGWQFWIDEGNPVPDRTWQLIKQCDATLVGAITSKPHKEATAECHIKGAEYLSPIIQLRKNLDLFANVRPCFSLKHDRSFNLCIIRENSEGLYAGFDYAQLTPELKSIVSTHKEWSSKLDQKISCSLRLQSEHGLQRIFQFAFDYASKHQYEHVTFADKPNVLRQSSAMARDIFESVAKQYPSITHSIENVDAVGMHLVIKPERFGVIVAENMFADILSDVAAGVMGGLGLAPSANVGSDKAYFEPVHGSGLRMHSQTANPSAMFLSIAMMLDHLGFTEQAKAVNQSVREVITEGNILTKDLGGHASTSEMADAMIKRAQQLCSAKA